MTSGAQEREGTRGARGRDGAAASARAASALIAVVLLGGCERARQRPGGHDDGGVTTARWFAEEVTRRTAPGDVVLLHRSLPQRDAVRAALARPIRDINAITDIPSIVADNPRAVVLMAAAPGGAERTLFVELVRRYAVQAFGDQALVDLRSSGPEIREFRFVEASAPSDHRTEEVAGPFLLCASVDAGVAPPADAPAAPTPPVAATDLARCHYNYQILRGDMARARDDLSRWRAAPDGLEGREAALGDLGHVAGFRRRPGVGAEVWWTIDRALPDGAILRWRVVPSSGGPPFIEEHPAWTHPSSRPATPGFLVVDAIVWSLPPGDYHLSIELGLRAPGTLAASARAELGEMHLP